MAKLIMLAGGIVEAGAGSPGAVSAFVAYNAGPGASRLFKVEGPASAPRVVELDAATTVDLGRFKRELQDELQPAVDAIASRGGTAAIATPKVDWVTDRVREHLGLVEGMEPG